jgi:hypothetical protein
MCAAPSAFPVPWHSSQTSLIRRKTGLTVTIQESRLESEM